MHVLVTTYVCASLSSLHTLAFKTFREREQNPKTKTLNIFLLIAWRYVVIVWPELRQKTDTEHWWVKKMTLITRGKTHTHTLCLRTISPVF